MIKTSWEKFVVFSRDSDQTKLDSLTLNLHNKYEPGVSRNFGTLSVQAEETVASKSAVEIAFRCSHLQNATSLKISRIVECGNSIPICKMEMINNNLNAIWRPITLSIQQFASNVSLSPSYTIT